MAKKRRQRKYELEYEKYKDIPEDKDERLEYLYAQLNIKDKDKLKIKELKKEIINKRVFEAKKIKLTFYIIPEGIARPRQGRGIFYVPNMKKFYDCMEDYMSVHEELKDLNIVSEIIMDCKYFRPFPSDATRLEKILMEQKIIRNLKKPDWDNLGKGTDMLHSIWLDDCLVTDARVRKYYSAKPRIEIRLQYYPNQTNSYHEKYINKLLKRSRGNENK